MNEFPNEMTTSTAPTARTMRPNVLGTRRSARGVGRVRSPKSSRAPREDFERRNERPDSFEECCAFFLVDEDDPGFEPGDREEDFDEVFDVDWRRDERGILEVLLPRDEVVVLDTRSFCRIRQQSGRQVRQEGQEHCGRGIPRSRRVVPRCATTGCTWRLGRCVQVHRF